MSDFVIYTDFHITPNTPSSRKDNYAQSLLSKLKQTYEIAKDKKVDAVLFLGDFFDKHKIYCFDIIREAIKIIDSIDVSTYAVIGQHDLIGYNKESYEKSTLHFLESFSNKFQTLWEPQQIGNTKIYPCHWFDDLRTITSMKLEGDLFNICLAHQTINDKTLMFKCLLTKDYPSDFDLILTGDWHGGYPIHKIGKTTWANPGALARRSIDDENRIVQIAYLKDNKLSYIELENIEKEVFERNFLDEIKEKATYNDSKFIEEIEKMNIQSLDIFELIEKVSKEKMIKKEVLDYIFSKKS